MKIDLYAILGVSKDAPLSAIKKAWKKMAQKFHPDKHDGDAEQFKRIALAYDVLSDEESRRKYDETGSVDEHGFSENQADVELVSMFSKIIDSGEFQNKNIIKYMKSTIIKFKAEGDSERGKAKSQIIRLEKLLNRVTDKKGNPTVFEELVQRRIDSENSRIEFIEKKQKILDEMLEKVDDYVDSYQEPTVTQTDVRFSEQNGWL